MIGLESLNLVFVTRVLLVIISTELHSQNVDEEVFEEEDNETNCEKVESCE